MSEPTLQQEIEARRPATEGTLQQVAKGRPLMGRDPDGKAKMINVDENGNVKVQQSGPNIIKTETVITRGIRTTNESSDTITPPVEARGFVAKLRVYGVTGTFETGEGVQMHISHRLARTGITRVFRIMHTKYQSNDRVHTCLWFPGLESNITLDSLAAQEAVGVGGVILIVGLPAHDAYRFSIRILGSFATGQGVDCDLVVDWYR